MRIRSLLITTYLLTLWCSSSGQGHDWWANNVNWDGVTHWSEYIIYAPRFLGPNALPVPEINSGIIDNYNAISLGAAAHFHEGDKTQNIMLSANYNLVADLISFDFYWVPWETFEVTHETKTMRNVFHTFYDATTAVGDVYGHMNLKLVKKASWSSVLRFGFKYPTSTKQGAARFTNAPGYFFDIGTSLDLIDRTDSSFRVFGMLGFYAWQTNLDEQFQNDALLVGLGIEYQTKTWTMNSGVRAYFGYLIGDKPIVVKQTVRHQWKHFNAGLSIQLGIQDYPYTSIMLTSSYRINDQ